MLDIEKLNKKLVELDGQNVIFINQINKLYELTYRNTYEINELTTEMRDTKTYRIVWRSGHHQTLSACNAKDAYTRTMDNFTGIDDIVAVYVDDPFDKWI